MIQVKHLEHGFEIRGYLAGEESMPMPSAFGKCVHAKVIHFCFRVQCLRFTDTAVVADAVFRLL